MSKVGTDPCGAYPRDTECRCGGRALFLQWGDTQGAFYYCETRDDCRGILLIDSCECDDAEVMTA